MMTPPLTGPSFLPLAGGKPEQLVILLHGYGSDGADLIGLAPAFAKALPKAAFIAPNAPESCEESPFGYQWFGLTDRRLDVMLEGGRRAAPLLDHFIDGELARLGLGPDRLALVGFSQGTMLALHVALRRADPLRAVVGFSGLLLGAERLRDEIRSRPPLLLIHGADDPVVPAAALPAAVEALKAVEVPVESLLIPGLGHGIDETGMSRALSFLVARFGEI